MKYQLIAAHVIMCLDNTVGKICWFECDLKYRLSRPTCAVKIHGEVKKIVIMIIIIIKIGVHDNEKIPKYNTYLWVWNENYPCWGEKFREKHMLSSVIALFHLNRLSRYNVAFEWGVSSNVHFYESLEKLDDHFVSWRVFLAIYSNPPSLIWLADLSVFVGSILRDLILLTTKNPGLIPKESAKYFYVIPSDRFSRDLYSLVRPLSENQ